MQNGGLAEVVRDRQKKRLVAGELGDGAFRLLVELPVGVQLREERLESPLLREHRHAEEERACILVLRDRLEPLEVLLPETEHLKTQRTCPPGGYGLGGQALLVLQSGLEHLGKLCQLDVVRKGDLQPA